MTVFIGACIGVCLFGLIKTALEIYSDSDLCKRRIEERDWLKHEMHFCCFRTQEQQAAEEASWTADQRRKVDEAKKSGNYPIIGCDR